MDKNHIYYWPATLKQAVPLYHIPEWFVSAHIPQRKSDSELPNNYLPPNFKFDPNIFSMP